MSEQHSKSFDFTPVAIVLLAFLLRSVALGNLPLFMDEAFHISWMQLILREGEWYVGIEGNKFLYPIMLSLFNFSGPEAVAGSRFVNAFVGTLATAAVIALGRSMGGRRAAVLAGLIYALLPLALFHERQALADPPMALFATLTTLFAVWLARTGKITHAVLLTLSLAGAYLSKISAAPYFVLPLIALLIFMPQRKQRWKSIVLILSSSAAAWLMVRLVYQAAAKQGWRPAGLYVASPDNLSILGGIDLARLAVDLREYALIMTAYVSWALLPMLVVFIVRAVRGEGWREALYLIVPGIAFAALPIVAERPSLWLAPRYLMVTAAPLAVLLAIGLDTVLTWFKQARVLRGIVVLIVLAPLLYFDFWLLIDPARAPLTDFDRAQYFTGDPSGVGWDALIADLITDWRQTEGRNLDLLASDPLWLNAALGPRVGYHERLRFEDRYQAVALAEWLAAGDEVYVVLSEDDQTHPVYGLQLGKLATYETHMGPQTLYRVSGAEGQLVDLIAEQTVPPLEKLVEPLAELNAQLQPDATVLVYPASHAVGVSESALPLHIMRWPVDQAAGAAALEALDLDSGVEQIEAILIDETASDPQRGLLLALHDRYYCAGEVWIGVWHRLTCTIGPLEPVLPEVNVVYEDAIHLLEGGVLQDSAQSGESLLVALRWQADVPVMDSYKVFVHITAADETVWAQYDSVPGRGLYPLTDWQPGIPVSERFALTLPADMSPGQYEVRIGIYHPEHGARLAVTAGPQIGPGYAVIDTVNVHEPPG